MVKNKDLEYSNMHEISKSVQLSEVNDMPPNIEDLQDKFSKEMSILLKNIPFISKGKSNEESEKNKEKYISEISLFYIHLRRSIEAVINEKQCKVRETGIPSYDYNIFFTGYAKDVQNEIRNPRAYEDKGVIERMDDIFQVFLALLPEDEEGLLPNFVIDSAFNDACIDAYSNIKGKDS